MQENEYIPKLVTLIVPVYNTAAYLAKCLDSVSKQTYRPLELILIDDGSTDDSPVILDNFSDDTLKIQIIHIDNHGVSYARNLGLSKATGEYITFMDSDDLIGPDYIENMIRTAEEHGSELVVSGYTMARISNENVFGKGENNKLLPSEGIEVLSTVVPHGYEQGINEAWAYRICACWGRLYKHEVWDRYQVRYEEGVRGEDVPISLFMNLVCRNIKILDKADYFYIQHDSSAMANFRGLKKYNLPYESMTKLFETARHCIQRNKNGCGEASFDNVSVQFYEYGYLRAMTQFIFDLGRGASRDKLHELCDWTYDFLAKYMPGYSRNEVLGHGSRFSGKIGYTLFQRISVRIMVMLAKCHMLYPVARILK